MVIISPLSPLSPLTPYELNLRLTANALKHISGNKRLIFPSTPFRRTTFEVLDVNKDKTLRKDITDWFHEHIQTWIENDKRFKSLVSKKNFLQTRDGYDMLYHCLRRFTKKYNYNWYDLRPNVETVKKYLIIKLDKVLAK